MSSLKERIAAQRQAIQDKNAGFSKSFKFLNGKTYFRLLPGKSDPSAFVETIGIHWIKDEKGNVVTAVGDRQICFGQACPVREAIDRYIQIGKSTGGKEGDAIVERGKDMLAKPRYFANIMVLKAPGEFEKDKAVIAEFTEGTWDTLLSQLEDYLEDLADDADLLKTGPFALDGGLTFVVERSGTGKKDTRYNVYIHAGEKKHAVPRAVYDGAVDLASYKRAQFDDKTRTALKVLATMTGADLTEIAGELASPSTGGALPPPSGKKAPAAKAAAAPEEDWGDDDLEGTATATATVSDSDILDELDDL